MANQFMTTGEIADELGVTRDRVEYIVRSRKIGPVSRAGNYRLFNAEQVEQIRQVNANPGSPGTPAAPTHAAGTGGTTN